MRKSVRSVMEKKEKDLMLKIEEGNTPQEEDSYNDGAGMHRVLTTAAFIKSNMPIFKPIGKTPNSLMKKPIMWQAISIVSKTTKTK